MLFVASIIVIVQGDSRRDFALLESRCITDRDNRAGHVCKTASLVNNSWGDVGPHQQVIWRYELIGCLEKIEYLKTGNWLNLPVEYFTHFATVIQEITLGSSRTPHIHVLLCPAQFLHPDFLTEQMDWGIEWVYWELCWEDTWGSWWMRSSTRPSNMHPEIQPHPGLR